MTGTTTPPNPTLTSAPPVHSDYSYDQVPYPNDPFPQSHPDRIATIATLFGMKPAPLDNCRILELGTGRGANITGMAASLPGAKCVGVELSKRQNDEAMQHAQAIGIKNLELKHMSITDVGDD